MEYADNDASSTTMKLSMHTLLRCPLAVSKSIAAKSFIFTLLHSMVLQIVEKL
jgi:hypothetical protein